MQIIDADGHVEESVAMLDRLEPELKKRRPIPLQFDLDTAYGQYNAVWMIDGEVYPKLVGPGGFILGTPTLMERARLKPVAIPAQELTDVAARLRDLDAAGIDQQVVFPTLFLTTTTEDVQLEAALFRAYNDFMGGVRQESGGRVQFAAQVPIRDVAASIAELGRAKALGACAVMLLGVTWDRTLDDEALCPFYEEAERLDLPVCLHFGWGSPAITSAFRAGQSFNSATLPVLMGARSVLASNLFEEFPRLRFAFLETGSQWLPWMLHQLKRSGKTGRERYFREGRAFVACEADEDINYITEVVGEDCFVVASDYPHGDPSHEDNLSAAIMAREDVPLRVREKILSANAQRLYAL
jgi:predicted TIM-barrel fold metal-dependent hydrolase